MKDNLLLWLDLEMTGLNAAQDVILEIAVVLTDSELNVVAQGPSLVVHQTPDKLAVMNDFVRKLHQKSGLLDLVPLSNVTLADAEQQVFDFIAAHCVKGTALLAGNSVWQDRNFLVAYMPRIVEYLHYRIIDVSTVKELARRWYPKSSNLQFKKADNHRAQEDVLASIEELKHYRQYFFISSTGLV